MKFDFSKTINEQLDTFDYYKNRYANYELTILKLQRENNDLKKQLEKKYEKVGTLTAEILYEKNTRLVNEITVLKTENQKLKEMQCTFLGTSCQNKIKEYKEVIDKAINWTKEYIKQWDSEDDVISDMEILLNILKEVE